jgi:hypothetical protein
VLGQVYGRYSDGTEALRAAVGADSWYKHDTVFCEYQDEWVEYLKRPIVPDKYADTEWVSRNYPDIKMTARQGLTFDGRKYVVFTGDDGSTFMRTESTFLANYKPVPPRPKYIEGRLYSAVKDGQRYILIYSETASHGKPGFYNLTHCTRDRVSWFEEYYGSLEELEIVGSESSFTQHGTVTLNRNN